MALTAAANGAYHRQMIHFAGSDFDVNAHRVAADGDVSRVDLIALSAMPNLRSLNLNSAGTTDEDLELVGRLTGLEQLDVSTTDITNAGVRHLRGLTKMRDLRIKETYVTDVGVAALAPMQDLTTLNLKGLDITDASLRLLANHPQLDLLVLSDGRRFSHHALAELRRRLPACEIVVDGRIYEITS